MTQAVLELVQAQLDFVGILLPQPLKFSFEFSFFFFSLDLFYVHVYFACKHGCVPCPPEEDIRTPGTIV